jgi:phospholipase A-2-activating protein
MIPSQTKVVREGDKGIAYSWNAAQGEWEQMGEVVGKKGGLDTSTNTVDGVEYDYVFDVQLEQSGPYLKLPYNKGDNPYEVCNSLAPFSLLS